MVTCDAFDSTLKESTTPKGVAFHTSLPRVASYRRQPWAIESTTPMGLHHHQPLIIMPPRGDNTRHAHLSAHHSMGCDHTTVWDCVSHRHSLPHHGIGMVSSMGIYYNSTIWGVTTSPRGIATTSPFIVKPRHRDGKQHGYLL